MKKITIPFIALLAMFVITSLTVKPTESQQLFEKIIFVEFSANEDSVLFQPYSKAWEERWISSSISINGTPLMDHDKYKFAFKNRTDNLWTIFHPLIIEGTIKSYWPYNPETFGFGTWDEGEMRFPVKGQDENGSFLTSETVRGELCNLLGRLGPQYDVPMIDEYGDNIIITHPDGTQSFQYQSPDFYWYDDKDITHYKLRVSVLVNKNGKEKKRVIKSISPMITRITETGENRGQESLIWLNFEEVEPFLAEAYFFDEDLKPVSYLEHIRQKVSNATIKPKG